VNDALRAERATAWLFAGAVAVGAAGPVRDNSLFTHLATGRLQVQRGLPDRNPFLWTSSDFPVPSWWWSGLLGRAEQAFGLGGVQLVTVVFAAALGWLLVRVSRPADHPGEPSRRLLAQVLPPAVTAVLLVPFLNGRPHLAGFVCLALALVVWRERRSPWWMVVVFAAWVNLHGSWAYGVVVLVLLGMAESIDLRRAMWGRWRWLVAAAGGLVLGGLAYPDRFRLLLLPTEQFGDEQARQAVRLYREWQPPGFDSPLGWVFAIVGLLALYGALRGRSPGVGGSAAEMPRAAAAPGAAAVPARAPVAVAAAAVVVGASPGAAPEPLRETGRPRPGSEAVERSHGTPRWGSVVAVVVLAGMGLGATRLLPIAAITLAAYAASGIEQLSAIGVPGTVARRVMVGLGAVLGVVALVQVARQPHLDLDPYPVTEVDWLEERGLVAEADVAVVAPDYVGNYLELRYGERANAWVDDRPSVQTFLDYDRLQHLSEGWQESLAEADPDVVLWERDEPLAEELRSDPSWRVGLTTDRYLVICRATTVGARCD
jgi:hypothetical protein